MFPWGHFIFFGVYTKGHTMSLAQHMENTLNTRNNGLGDRSLYFGASEILSCEEAMYLSKIEKISKPRTLQELIVLLKGNIGENLVEWGFGEALKFEGQVECKGTGEYAFITAHADFMVHFPLESIIVEVKTTNDIPDSIRESWYLQVQVQLGLLGLKRGKVIAMNLNSGHHAEFDVSFNQLIFETTLQTMKDKWDRIHDENTTIKGKKSALCGYCLFKLQCQTLKTDNLLPDDVEAMAIRSKALKKEIKILDENIKAFMLAADYERARGKEIVIDMPRRSSGKRVDANKLKLLYPEIYEEVCNEPSYSNTMNIY